ncbi:glutamine synthetase family protein [Tepidicaulis sp.]|uniref:glutamine synthetase family protein n=1 Tax=Tepidicaulis sp. TaxID=1920809 RepID=UPI003B5932E7
MNALPPLDELNAFLKAHADADEFTLVFTDLCGVARGKVLRRAEIEAAFRDGRFMPGSIMSLDVTGTDVEETGLVWEDGDADRIARPVPGSLVPSPLEGPRAGQFIVRMTEADGTPSVCDPRNVLERVVARFEELKLTPVAAIELEFYLFDREAAAKGAPQPPLALNGAGRAQHFQAYQLSDLTDFSPFFRDVYESAQAQGLPARTLISEYAPGQMEIVLQHQPDAMKAADQAIMFKRLIKLAALKHGMMACFMAKPYSAYSGSGMHVHVSLAGEDGANAFADENPKGNALMRHAIGGLKATMAEMMGIWAPNANSYRRFRAKSYAPVSATWGVNNRTVSLRIPAGAAPTRHIEHRIAGADANPYLALAGVLAGIHHGITGKMDPGPAVEGNGYELPSEPFPLNWFRANEVLRQSAFARDYFGNFLVETFCTIKEAEADRFFAEPTPLDFDYYLRTV